MDKKKLELALCAEMGRLAFDEGKKCVPAWDKNIMSVISDSRKTLDTREVLRAWIAGWTQANLEAD